jgi:segregation and condensation protein A
MLLPVDPELQKLSPEEDPRQELVEQLIQHESFKNAAEMLQQKRVVEEAVWSNPQIQRFLAEDDQPGLAVTIFDLVKTFQTILERTKNRPLYEVGREQTSVPDMIRFLQSRLTNKEGRGRIVSATELIESQASQHAMICLFLAILEMVKRQLIHLSQGEAFGEIGLEAREESVDSSAPQAALSDEELTAVDSEYN